MSRMSNATTATLLVSCRDRTGLVAALSDFVFRHDGNILDADQHAERAEGEDGFFFMRLRWDLARFRLEEPAMREALRALGQRFDLTWELTIDSRRQRVAIFVRVRAPATVAPFRNDASPIVITSPRGESVGVRSVGAVRLSSDTDPLSFVRESTSARSESGAAEGSGVRLRPRLGWVWAVGRPAAFPSIRRRVPS